MRCFVIARTDNSYEIETQYFKKVFARYPESYLSIREQISFYEDYKFRNNGYDGFVDIVTESPFIISNFKTKDVLVWSGKSFIHPAIETFGASFETILIGILNITSDIGLTPFNEIKKVLSKKTSITDLQDLNDRLGHSWSKRFLYRKIDEIKLYQEIAKIKDKNLIHLIEVAQYKDGGSILFRDDKNKKYWQCFRINPVDPSHIGKLFVSSINDYPNKINLAKGHFILPDGRIINQ